MAGRVGQGELLAGGAAAALFLVAVALSISSWLAILLALTTYAGVVLLWPRRSRRAAAGDDARRQHLAYQSALANASAIRMLAQRIAKPAVREHVDRILGRIARVLAAMREDGSLAAAPVFDEQLLTPFRAVLTEYVRLAGRGVRSADGLLERTESRDLALIEQAVDTFYEQLHRGHMIDLATLSDVLELNLGSIQTRRTGGSHHERE